VKPSTTGEDQGCWASWWDPKIEEVEEPAEEGSSSSSNAKLRRARRVMCRFSIYVEIRKKSFIEIHDIKL
jgi:hypothetical protein